METPVGQTDGGFGIYSGPRGIRIPVSGLRGRRPRPLDDGATTLDIVTDTVGLSMKNTLNTLCLTSITRIL